MLCAQFPEAALTDAAQAARAVFAAHERDLFAGLCAAKNGRVLLQKGREEEVRWCAQVSRLDVVGVLKNGAVRASTAAGC